MEVKYLLCYIYCEWIFKYKLVSERYKTYLEYIVYIIRFVLLNLFDILDLRLIIQIDSLLRNVLNLFKALLEWEDSV